MKHLFIVNPVAGGRDATGDVKARVEAAFQNRGEPYEIYVTRAPMDAAEKIRAEAASGEELRVYACGGDGTFNECVCGAALLPNVALAPFPTGTGNDFCRMFGEEKDLFRDLPALLEGLVHPIDLIDVNGRYSANIASVGIDARIGCDVHKYSKIPVIGGTAGYVVSLLVNIFKGIATNMRVKSGDFSAAGKHSLVCACNGRFYGGGFNPSLDAMPDDGELDIFVVKGVGVVKLGVLIGRYASGRSDEISDYVTHLHGTEVDIELDKPDVVNVDGEAVVADRIRMRLVPGALRLIVPAGMRFFGEVREPAAAT
ncbi:MAG: YegS/Rv2252/BmrU family lipid kinase [Oscillospiraceae bacterium]|nr:YegS/Rv2252/BmrU family lipid kinase [Oscillospiraceae bacterium]